MLKELGLYELDNKNVEKYEYQGEPILPAVYGDYLRKTFGFFPAPEKFAGNDNELLLQNMKFESYSTGEVDFNELQVKSTDGSILDTIDIVPFNKGEKPVHVINIFGAVDSFEQNMDYMKEQSERLGVVNVGFNVPGVGRSTGTLDSKHSAIKAGVAQVIRLVENGVEPEKIVISGHSAGAAIAVACGEHLHKKGLAVNVFNNRSFGKTSTVASAFLTQPAENHIPDEKSFKRFLPIGYAAKAFTTTLGSIAGWEIDVNKAFNNIPPQSKEYILIKPDKIDRMFMTGDEMVRPVASLHYMQGEKRREIKEDIKGAIKLLGSKEYIEKLSEKVNNLEMKLSASLETKEILARIVKNIDLMKKEPQSALEAQYKGPYFSDVRNDLKELYNQVKFERKFVVNTTALLKDIDKHDVLEKRYHERCDRFLLNRDGNIKENLKEIHKFEPYYADWMALGLLNEKELKGEAKRVEVNELANKMDVHAIPLEYIIQRKEKPLEKQSGLEYFEKFIQSRNNPIKPIHETYF